jgi:putative membrane protein
MIDYDAKSWIRVMFRVRGTVLVSLLPRVLLTVALGLVALRLHGTRGFRLPATSHALVGVALGLLLVFRTNASYDRYWEGRKLLGTMVNRSRDLMRQVAAYVDGDAAAARAKRADVARLIAVTYALIRQHLRRERDLGALGASLTDAERAELEPLAARPGRALQWVSTRLAATAAAGQLSDVRLAVMDANLTAIVDAWGGADRILNTPVPFAYAHHIKVFLALFCFTVPFVLVDTMGRLTPLVAAVVSYGMFGIEEIGVEIEDPFGYDPNDLPLDRIGEVIARDVAAAAVAARDAAS